MLKSWWEAELKVQTVYPCLSMFGHCSLGDDWEGIGLQKSGSTFSEWVRQTSWCR